MNERIEDLVKEFRQAKDSFEMTKEELEDRKVELDIARFNLDRYLRATKQKTINTDEFRVSLTRRTTKRAKPGAQKVLEERGVDSREYMRVDLREIIKILEREGLSDFIDVEVKESVAVTDFSD